MRIKAEIFKIDQNRVEYKKKVKAWMSGVCLIHVDKDQDMINHCYFSWLDRLMLGAPVWYRVDNASPLDHILASEIEPNVEYLIVRKKKWWEV